MSAKGSACSASALPSRAAFITEWKFWILARRWSADIWYAGGREVEAAGRCPGSYLTMLVVLDGLARPAELLSRLKTTGLARPGCFLEDGE
ncbi:hypothetical protein [Noviherbaspirillum suwonense]|uniref:hypothetical protein n=1 Tax=Noviherbaspirillum suwonense TaxID=1224511 RepID=UPI0024B84FEE|nr:hypothetical protein [Noviherbaspirillum suwonense]